MLFFIFKIFPTWQWPQEIIERRWLGMDEKKPRGEELLLQYVKEVLQEPSKARLDISALPKELQSLGK